MKTILFSLGFLLLSTPVFSCMNKMPASEVEKAMKLEPNAGAKTCAELSVEQCFCFDGITWEIAELADNLVVDYITKSNDTACISFDDCDIKFSELTCGNGFTPIKNYDLLQVYCTKPVMKIDGKKLVNSPAKKTAHEAKKEDDRLKEKEKKDKEVVDLLTILTTDMSKTMSTKEITEYLKKLQDVLKSKGIL
jgi:hypothetical protein